MRSPFRLSRRDFLSQSAALAVAARLPVLAASPGSFRFVTFSDTHFGLTSNFDENVSMFREMRDGGYAFGLNGGDITDYGWPGQYRRYREALKTLPFRVRNVPGNHDVRWSPLGPKAYVEGTGDSMFGSFDHEGCHFVLLDTTVPLSHWGHFESRTLRWLEQDLHHMGRESPVFMTFHHWVGRDGIQTDNERDLLRVIEPYNVKVLLNGHGHSDLYWTWNGVPNTMCKGLYQLSYQAVDVDRQAGNAVVRRRTKESTAFHEIVSVPLKPARAKLPLWTVPAVLNAGGAHVADAHPATQFRWDDGAWRDLGPDRSVPAAGIPGTHRLSLRASDSAYFDAGTTVGKDTQSVLVHRWTTKLKGGVMSHLRLHDGELFVSAMDGSTSAIEAKTGKVRWTSLASGYCHSSPCVLDRIVVVGAADGHVNAYSRTNGALVWSYKTQGPVYGSGAFAKGVVAIPSGDGRVYGFHADSGALAWTYDLPASNTAFVQSPVATDGERFYLGAWDSHVYGLDAATGGFLWRHKCCPDKTFAYSPAIGGPIVFEGNVIVPANGNVLYAINGRTGEVVWSTSSPGDKFGYSSPVLAGDRVVVGCLGDKGEGRCVSAADGSILWTVPTGAVIYDSGPAVVGAYAVFASVCGLLTVARMSDGKIMAQHQLSPGHLLSTPASDGKYVYVGSFSDEVSCYKVDA